MTFSDLITFFIAVIGFVLFSLHLFDFPMEMALSKVTIHYREISFLADIFASVLGIFFPLLTSDYSNHPLVFMVIIGVSLYSVISSILHYARDGRTYVRPEYIYRFWGSNTYSKACMNFSYILFGVLQFLYWLYNLMVVTSRTV